VETMATIYGRLPLTALTGGNDPPSSAAAMLAPRAS